MPFRHPARRARRRGRFPLVTILVVTAVPIAVLNWLWPRMTSAATAPTVAARLQGDHASSGVGAADGWLPDGVTVFDADYPGVSQVDPALLAALRRAAQEADGSGITFYVTTGWRSAAYQEQLLDQAVSTYGSKAEAARWVATPTTSAHVKGQAVDIGRSDSMTWLSKHGAAYGLCQIYRNEPWHYELRPKAVAKGCPSMYADPTYDPRMSQ